MFVSRTTLFRNRTATLLVLIGSLGASPLHWDSVAGEATDSAPEQPQPTAQREPTTPSDSPADQIAFQSSRQAITADGLMKHVAFLAADERQGRRAGTPGGTEAGDYIAARLAEMGVQGGGPEKRYFQPFGTGFDKMLGILKDAVTGAKEAAKSGEHYRNVLGLLEGSDREARKELILVGAHYDHMGTARVAPEGEAPAVYNGADDNASGTAGVLELAAAFARLPHPPRRSILFALWDAEERGLVGSKHWVSQPTLPDKQVLFVVNADMIGRLRDNRVIVWGARTGYNLRRLVSFQNVETDLTLDFPPNNASMSDHFPFFRGGIPTLFFFTGVHPELHRAEDDVALINAEGMRRIVQLMFGVIHDAANRPAVPGFRESSSKEVTGDPRPRRVPLALRATDSLYPEGLACRGEDAEPEALTVVAVVRGSSACSAGLQAGDRIYQVQGADVGPQRPLAAVLAATAQTVPLLVERDGRLRTIDVKTVAAGASPASIVSLDALFRPAAEGVATTSPAEVAVHDEFEGRLDRRWEIQNADLSSVSLTERPGTLTLHAQPGSYFQDNTDLKNLFLFPNPAAETADYEATTCLAALPEPGSSEQAGLVCFKDADNYAELVCEWDASGSCRRLVFRKESRGRASEPAYVPTLPAGDRLWLRLANHGNQLAYSISTDGQTFTACGETTWSGGPARWIGVTARNPDGTEPSGSASFDVLSIRTPPPAAVSASP